MSRAFVCDERFGRSWAPPRGAAGKHRRARAAGGAAVLCDIAEQAAGFSVYA